MRRTRSACLTAVVAAAASLSLAAPARAVPETAPCTPAVDAGTESGMGRVLGLMDDLRESGHGRAEIDAVLADLACMTRVPTTTGEPVSARAAALPDAPVDVTAPSVYVITEVNGRDRWVAITEWSWRTVPTYPMTGNQGIATWFSSGVNPIVQVVHHSGHTSQFPNVSREDASDLNDHGVSFLMAPRTSATDLNVARGMSSLVFEGRDGCADPTVTSSYSHSFGSTSISAIDISADGQEVHWTAEDGRAQSTGPATRVAGVCS
ncbi:hypothetical protein [Streptomyces marincola]|uniref:hypothetical protein n=1 Tax=Streptomyces marincola TaxID=2878388 RepID=UPI001CF17FB8|nr:hypothetical protein [Streptomyces marincola]UCM87597.1 hypothetical protein LC193_06345 [Streptomyces marincola]